MPRPKKLDAAVLVPPRAGGSGKTPQEKAARAIAIRESTAKIRKGKPMTFPMRRVPD
jgi:hypothetical protein